MIPELDFESPPGTGRFCSIYDILHEYHIQTENASHAVPENQLSKFNDVLASLKNMMQGKTEFQIFLDDPLGNSRVGLVENDDENCFSITKYKRTWMQEKEYDLLQKKDVFQGKEGKEKLVELIKKSKKICGLTGAGISTGFV
jgi:C4-type Zn-finger protein